MIRIKPYLLVVLALLLFWGCEKSVIQENPQNTNLQDFEMAWEVADQHYPYFELKGVNWDELYEVYYPGASESKGDEIYTVLIEMFSHLRDGHMYLETEGGLQMTPWIPTRRIKDLYAFNPTVIGQYFEEEFIHCSEDNINYQILPENIGYLNIQSFSGEYSFRDMDQIFNFFKNTTGLIIDIRHNYGGDIHNVDKIVGHFISLPIPRNPYYHDFELLEMDDIQPSGTYNYNNPVVLLANGVSFSASEIATEIFKEQIAHVTVIGDTTGGGSLGYINKYENGDFILPSGKLFHIGNLDVRKYNGEPFENIGIVPDIVIPQSETDILAGHDKQLEFAINHIESKSIEHK
nr:hypothetical protein [Bacteroidota bacterium]